jgi:alanyl-tRNA synthetase
MVFHFDHVLGADILSWLEIGVSLVLEQLQPYYVSLESVSKDSLVECISHEVAKFQKTLQTGTQLVHKKIADIDGRTLLGDVVFQLYDTYGFPVDLTREIAARE